MIALHLYHLNSTGLEISGRIWVQLYLQLYLSNGIQSIYLKSSV